MLKSIDDEWKGFAAMVFAKMDPSPVQVEEMRRAFFAGAWAMICAVERIGEPDITEGAGIEYLENRKQEGLRFYRELIKRYSEGN